MRVKKISFLVILLMSTSFCFAVLPPKYLTVPAFDKCLKEKKVDSHTAWCLPKNKPVTCPKESWAKLSADTSFSANLCEIGPRSGVRSVD
jgi:hypothetical protein